jgi:hypothetical protein
MKLSELGLMKFEASKAASDQARSLALAGLAIVWLFAGPFFTKGEEKPPDSLFVAGGLLAIALALDLLQLVVRTVALEVSYQATERKADVVVDDPLVSETPGVNVATAVFFYLKMLALVVGYGFVVGYFGTKAF